MSTRQLYLNLFKPSNIFNCSLYCNGFFFFQFGSNSFPGMKLQPCPHKKCFRTSLSRPVWLLFWKANHLPLVKSQNRTSLRKKAYSDCFCCLTMVESLISYFWTQKTRFTSSTKKKICVPDYLEENQGLRIFWTSFFCRKWSRTLTFFSCLWRPNSLEKPHLEALSQLCYYVLYNSRQFCSNFYDRRNGLLLKHTFFERKAAIPFLFEANWETFIFFDVSCCGVDDERGNFQKHGSIFHCQKRNPQTSAPS